MSVTQLYLPHYSPYVTSHSRVYYDVWWWEDWFPSLFCSPLLLAANLWWTLSVLLPTASLALTSHLWIREWQDNKVRLIWSSAQCVFFWGGKHNCCGPDPVCPGHVHPTYILHPMMALGRSTVPLNGPRSCFRIWFGSVLVYSVHSWLTCGHACGHACGSDLANMCHHSTWYVGWTNVSGTILQSGFGVCFVNESLLQDQRLSPDSERLIWLLCTAARVQDFWIHLQKKDSL